MTAVKILVVVFSMIKPEYEEIGNAGRMFYKITAPCNVLNKLERK
jgi:hypothetical protein